MTSTASVYQLPDLLGLMTQHNFDLRTNKHYKSTVPHFEQFTSSEFDAKYNLLSALCFPTCDLSQFRMVTDVLTAVLLTDWRTRALGISSFHDSPPITLTMTSYENILESHIMFKHLPSLTTPFSKMSQQWKFKFSNCLFAWRQAHSEILSNRKRRVILKPSDYLPLRRDAFGLSILFCMTEACEGLKSDCEGEEMMMTLARNVEEFLTVAFDIFSYSTDQANGNTQNIVSSLIQFNGCSVQRAVSIAEETFLQDSFQSFISFEQSLYPVPPPIFPAPVPNIITRLLSPLSTSPSSPSSPNVPKHIPEDLDRYIQSLKDFMIGMINWTFETELYFGKKGDNVRTFRWVFLSHSQPNE